MKKIKKMSSKSSILIFFLFSGYPSINVVRSYDIPIEQSVYDTATKLINPMKPSTVEGTYWCGDDIETASRHDLGPAEETDRCCKQWHHCDEFIAPKAYKYGFRNEANYRIPLCYCTEKFYYCLKKVSGMESVTAQLIGVAYFNVINPKCLRKMYYAQSCKTLYHDVNGVTYSNNTNNEHNYFCPMLEQTQFW